LSAYTKTIEGKDKGGSYVEEIKHVKTKREGEREKRTSEKNSIKK
jgi:hypothetical protein